eukprot:m.96709 g.96709  ORF g.96709 m.96709 type:complete len:135 (-) comp13082_c0_seq2:296-700(-)
METETTFAAPEGLYFDELSKIRTIEPEKHEATAQLGEECKEFMGNLETFQKVVGGFVGLVDKLAKGVDAEKMKAIGAKSAFESAHKRKEAEEQLLMATIAEKKAQLERLKVEQQSLETIIQEQDQFIEHYVMRK